MSFPETLWDCLTANHLNAWLKRSVHDDDRKAAWDSIVVALSEYPELVKDRSWPEIRAIGDGMKEAQDKAIEKIGCTFAACNYPMCDCGFETRTWADEITLTP